MIALLFIFLLSLPSIECLNAKDKVTDLPLNYDPGFDTYSGYIVVKKIVAKYMNVERNETFEEVIDHHMHYM
mgnify:CR=1 FL=1